VTVKRSHHADPGEHRWPVMFGNQQERCHCSLHSSASCSAFGSMVM
jgi:hypothetical protein